MKKTRLVVLLIIGIFFFSVTTMAEEITLTTYYPAPYGEYQNLYVSGNVGIGTTNPQRILHVHTGGFSNIMFTNTASGTTTADGLLIELDTGGANTNIWNYENGFMRFATNNAERMRISAAGGLSFGSGYVGTDPGVNNVIIQGNVGIGTTTPTAKLQVAGGNILLNNATQIGWGNGTTGVYASTAVSPYRLTFSVNGDRMWLQSDNKIYMAGNVGIGGDPRPADRLAVYGRVSTNFPGAGTQQMFSFDLAEDISATPDVEAGDVVVIDSTTNEQITKSTKPYDSFVAGIVSTSPAFHIAMPDGKTPLALAGRVKCKVTTRGGGPVKRGDLLVTSSKPGYAMRARPENVRIGTVLGKALEPLDSGDGKIMVLVTLQ